MSKARVPTPLPILTGTATWPLLLSATPLEGGALGVPTAAIVPRSVVAPLVIDRLSALLGPAWIAAREGAGEANPPFARLQSEIATFAATPSGVGLDVPPWLRRLEGELHRVRHEPARGTRARSVLTADQLRSQIGREWGGPLEE